MLEAIYFTTQNIFSFLRSWLNTLIPLGNGLNIKVLSIILFQWSLWFVFQVLHLGLHIHTADQKSNGGKYARSRD